MEFKHPIDTKSFLIGICASLTAVILWDTFKFRQQLLEFERKQSNGNS